MTKQRNEIEEKYQWDLTTIFPTDEAWEAELADLTADIEKPRILLAIFWIRPRPSWTLAKPSWP